MKTTKTTILTIITITLFIGAFIFVSTSNNKYGELTKITYDEIITKQQNEEDFIVIFSRSDCSHCATYKPKVNQISKKYNITTYYIDIDKYSDKEKILNEFKLSGATPMTLFFKKGKETSILHRIEGDLSSKVIEQTFKKMGFINK